MGEVEGQRIWQDVEIDWKELTRSIVPKAWYCMQIQQIYIRDCMDGSMDLKIEGNL